jgi:hypothetical protein
MKKSASGIVERKVPSMSDGSPPVTREMMFLMAAGPLKVALSPVPMSNLEKE